MQHVYDVLGLLSRPSKVEKTETWCSDFTPRGKERGVVDVVFCVHQLQPHQTSAHKTFDMTLCNNVHSGDAIGSFV